jgi:hypothetical protein
MGDAYLGRGLHAWARLDHCCHAPLPFLCQWREAETPKRPCLALPRPHTSLALPRAPSRSPALLYLAPTLPWPFLVLPLALALPVWATAMAKPSSYRRCSLPSLTSHPRVPLRLPHRAPQPPCGRPCQPPAPTASCRPIAVIAFVALLLRHCCLQPWGYGQP